METRFGYNTAPHGEYYLYKEIELQRINIEDTAEPSFRLRHSGYNIL